MVDAQARNDGRQIGFAPIQDALRTPSHCPRTGFNLCLLSLPPRHRLASTAPPQSPERMLQDFFLFRQRVLFTEIKRRPPDPTQTPVERQIRKITFNI